MTAINQNQQAFLQMMSQGGGGQSGSEGAAAGGEAGIPPGAHVIRLTPEEHAAVQRIKSMGLNVPDQLIIEVCFIRFIYKFIMSRHTLLVTRMKN